MTVAGDARPDLAEVSTASLGHVRDALASGRLRTPVTTSGLQSLGIRHHAHALSRALGGHSRAACTAILDVALAERAKHNAPAPELVWTGPEARSATARDTAVVLRRLFEGARQRVVLAGYSFDHAQDVLRPLHRVMQEHGVDVTFFVNIEQPGREQPNATPAEQERYAVEQMGGFVANSWPFGEPYPRLYYDPRALQPGRRATATDEGHPWCSVHAKCVVVDNLYAFVSSANFTQRGQERNVEAGVLLQDARFAAHLSRQWMGLAQAGLMVEMPFTSVVAE